MKIVWDETKRLANLKKHGFDFAAPDLDFFRLLLLFQLKTDV
jgi:uncharacterized protein